MKEINELLGKGIYPVSTAARLTAVPARTIRRWVKGYDFPGKTGPHHSPAVWPAQWRPIDGAIALGFLDLVEVRIVSAFLDQGISWKTIRLAANHACKIFQTSHPFATAKFKVDGKSIFAEHHDDLIDLKDCQLPFRKVVEPFLRDLEFGAQHALRWWPLGIRKRTIVIDPQRNFGQPIVAKEGVPTAALANAFAVEQDEAAVARWYRVSRDDVRESVKFEKGLAAAA
jgi:uncharacterized protein (DUF433 family)